MKKRIAILFHEQEKQKNMSMYSIHDLAKVWMDDGNEVYYIFGTKRYIPADIIIVHVDLSVVPDEYLEFARQYPISVNGGAKDIRKTLISNNLLSRGDSYKGKVIVKTNLNFAGQPELWVGVKHSDDRSLFRSPRDYPVYNHLHEVPEFFFESPDYIVEKFLPEIKDGLFIVRLYYFLGDRDNCIWLTAKHPIVNGSTYLQTGHAEPNPEIRRIRKNMKFDYGKLDYVINNGKVVLLDANKTTGSWAIDAKNKHLNLGSIYRERAQGLYSYFE